MTPVTCFAGRAVALFGLGGSGLATALALAAGGADVTAWDDKEASRDKARAAGIAVADLAAADWSAFTALVLSPGVPLTHPQPHWSVRAAVEAGLPVIGDVGLFALERAHIAPDAPLVAITGTNGKSTTTALTAHLLRQAGCDVQMGGNIGTAILSLEPPARGRVHVVECSSFQIDLAPSLAPSVGVLLNVTPDHLDRHGTMENYAGIKERLVAAADLAVVGVDDDWCRAVAARREAGGRPLARISVAGPLDDGLFAADGGVVDARENPAVFYDLKGQGSLRGAHNAQNAAAAIAAARALGVEPDAIRRGLTSFPGLAHRMEQVGRVGRVLFINDSKATNADAAEKALAAFPGGIHWIIGGLSKEGGIEPLAPYFPRVSRAYLIGASSDVFAATLGGSVPHEACGTLDVAVAAAAQAAATDEAAAEPVVLLSPACASYDQYPNFEARGAHFRDLVQALPGLVPAGAPQHGEA